MKKRIWFQGLCATMIAVLCFLTVGCQPSKVEDTAMENVGKAKVSMAVIKGPTGMGAAYLMEQNAQGLSKNDYTVTVAASPDEVAAKVINKEVDIAMLPTNLAAVLYQKTQGSIEVAAVNTLGVLYLLEKGDSIHSLADLSGKTVSMAGQGAVPQYVFQYLLDKNQVTDVTIQYMTEHAEVATALATGQADIVILPEPNVSGVLMNDESARAALDFNQLWAETVGEESSLPMGCVVVQKDFLENNKEAFELFLEEYENSVLFAKEEPEQTAQLIQKHEILPKAEIALKAFPNCNIVYMDGILMKETLEPFYELLWNANPKAVGETMPDESFYYEK
jgi:NitT/TauT family transport system substrate-binding protein